MFLETRLSSLVADVYMSHLAQIVLNSPLVADVLLLRRFVDDVFCCWSGPVEYLHIFLDYLNFQHPAIKFTMEEGDPSLSYLDLRITLDHTAYGLTPDIRIYRKPAFTGISIHEQPQAPQDGCLDFHDTPFSQSSSLPNCPRTRNQPN